MSVDELRKELKITRSSVRQHLISLKGKGLVDCTVKKQSVGRPILLYSLTEKAGVCYERASDRRREERIKKEVFVVLDYNGQHLEAESTDFSKEGVGIRISGETPLAVGETVRLSTGYLRTKAEISWITRLIDQSLVGLHRIS